MHACYWVLLIEKFLKTCYVSCVLVCILKKICKLNSYFHIKIGADVTRENYENLVQFGAFWCIFDQMVF